MKNFKYFLLILLITGFKSVGQGHKAEIAAFRKQYMADFLEDKYSPVKAADLQYLRFYDADSTYKITAHAELVLNAPTFLMPVYTGTGSDYVKYAVLKMVVKGKPVELNVYRSVALAKRPATADYLFLPFTDDTNGKSTYGGGRYIDLHEKDFKDGIVIIDFNKAYNPYCAFGAGFACPKPPDENHLNMSIEAGEKLYAKGHQ
ncbi:MAG: DUF1684 domain-containing protein [Mucilaginibacter sp.]